MVLGGLAADEQPGRDLGVALPGGDQSGTSRSRALRASSPVGAGAADAARPKRRQGALGLVGASRLVEPVGERRCTRPVAASEPARPLDHEQATSLPRARRWRRGRSVLGSRRAPTSEPASAHSAACHGTQSHWFQR